MREGFGEGFRGDLFQKLGEVMGVTTQVFFKFLKKIAQKKLVVFWECFFEVGDGFWGVPFV